MMEDEPNFVTLTKRKVVLWFRNNVKGKIIDQDIVDNGNIFN